MADDMSAVSLVQDIGSAVLQPPFITYRANPNLHCQDGGIVGMREGIYDQNRSFPTISMKDIDDYFRLMSFNRAFGLPITTPGNGTVWLFLLARELQPKTIVESGVYHGSSLYTLRHAVPEAKIFAFDVTFADLFTRFRASIIANMIGALMMCAPKIPRICAFSTTTSTTVCGFDKATKGAFDTSSWMIYPIWAKFINFAIQQYLPCQ